MQAEAITQEHQRTVSAARLSMVGHDAQKPLRRWFNNYKDNKDAFLWSFEWAVVTREGRRWKVETGSPDADKPNATHSVDPRAPEPPIFEFRPPKPKIEPIKPREIMPPLPRVPSALEYMERGLSWAERDELRWRIRERQARRRPARPFGGRIDWDAPFYPDDLRFISEPISEREMMAMVHAILDRRFRYRPPATPQPVRPPPTPTRRNQ